MIQQTYLCVGKGSNIPDNIPTDDHDQLERVCDQKDSRESPLSTSYPEIN